MNVVIVQARLGSSRLPGKVLQDLNGAPVIAHVLARAREIPRVERVCCAIPEGIGNDELAEIARRHDAIVCRGPEDDVLLRYLIAARACQAQVIMRITCDCPLLDPDVSSLVLDDFLAGGAEYASNVCPASWPRGLDTEVFSLRALELAASHATAAYDREHVTPWLQCNPAISSRNISTSAGDFANWRWTLDYEADLAFMRTLLAQTAPFPYLPRFDELRAVLELHPDIATINAGLR